MKIKSLVIASALVGGLFTSASAITTTPVVTFQAPAPVKTTQHVQVPMSHRGDTVNLTMNIDSAGKPSNIRVANVSDQQAYKRIIETVSIASYDHITQGELRVLKTVSAEIAALGGGEGRGILVVDDLVDTGQTARLVRELLPQAHFAAVYAKPMGRPAVDTFITEVSQDTWIFFPWDTGLAFQPPIRDGAA